MKRILSGITPSSTKGLHLGNYFGAVKPHVDFQNEGECFYFVANVHALNTVFSGKEVEANTMNIFLEYLALGIDPNKTTFFVESDIEQIVYLQTILNNAVTIAELQRMHGYKDKLAKDVSPDSINMGLFSYPVLMAADILAFKPDVVPVGDDQKQHVEICREIAKTFNNRYGKTLKIPEVYIKAETARVIGIDGERKMGKSLGNDIPIFGTEAEIKKQITSIKTDPSRIHANDPGDPAKNVAFSYLELLDYDNSKLEDMKSRYKQGSIGDVEIKEQLFDLFMGYFSEVRKKKQELESNMDYIYELRQTGADKARAIAEVTLKEVKEKVGFATKKVATDKKPIIQYDDFAKLEIKIGEIVECSHIEGADKLLKLIIDFGTETRQILSGIAEFYKPEELVGKKMPVLVNLAPRMMRGLESQGMIIAADAGTGVALLHPNMDLSNGSMVK